MRYTGIQPQYFPRLHYFARILNTDVFVLRDDAQFVRKHKYPDGKTGKSYQAHTPIKTPAGIFLLSLPTKHDGFKPLYKTGISYDLPWVEDHLKTIHINYANSPYFEKVFKDLNTVFSSKFNTIASLNTTTIIWGILYLLGEKIEKEGDLNLDRVNKTLKKQNKFRLKNIYKATNAKATSDLKKFDSLSPNEKIIALCEEFGANEDYCGGTGVAAYVDHEIFKKKGITINVQDWNGKPYKQLFQKQQGFIPNLSVLDLLFNVSSDEALSILNS